MHDSFTCRFCGSPATVKAVFDKGCVCYPHDREQWLCEQHWCNSEPIGTAQVVIDLLR